MNSIRDNIFHPIFISKHCISFLNNENDTFILTGILYNANMHTNAQNDKKKMRKIPIYRTKVLANSHISILERREKIIINCKYKFAGWFSTFCFSYMPFRILCQIYLFIAVKLANIVFELFFLLWPSVCIHISCSCIFVMHASCFGSNATEFLHNIVCRIMFHGILTW